ncbi:2-dehydropantoate 2-reductase [Demequina zhanjiangensis]|uniref:2-dehydropantoate 2-reductase n=1 Tax=Demequina zhanjiangensis TaxID=3051659 RepID=A0ABT8G0H4_9MICO|nr:2-dehydropantoate 2-reductase [Demequina sp. SYSU T00b26]MDN4472578.1 2-dehydropantoate 2-reductase [Demequina sp. SYSU T00b26]
MPASPKVAIVGAGAIGLAIGSAFARAGSDVTLCGGRTPVESITIVEDGAPETWRARHVDDPSELGGVDVMVLAVKAYATDAMSAWLRAGAAAGATILVAQNGVEQVGRVAPHVGDAEAVPAIVYLNVERTAPGTATLRRVGEHDIALPATPAGREIAEILATGRMRMNAAEDFLDVLWTKMMINCAGNSLTALTRRRAPVLLDPAVAEVARSITREVASVARAEGARLTDADADAVVAWLQAAAPANNTSSMREDVMAGRPIEHDALTGAIVRLAARHGMDVPVNTMILALLGALRPEEG